MNARCHLRELRGDRSLHAIARLAGLNSPDLSRIERGIQLPPAEHIIDLEAAYGAPLAAWYDWRQDGAVTVDGAPAGLPPKSLTGRDGREHTNVLVVDGPRPVFHAWPSGDATTNCGRSFENAGGAWTSWLRTAHALAFARPCKSCFPGGVA